MLSKYLQENDQDLAFAYLIWKRERIRGIGYGINLNHLTKPDLKSNLPSS